ncbi:endolytic transglycosylase MltG [Streptomyces sp. NPDC018031]|uniref:endolytic transglycosylase MltG n=1 Tax=Streptomyces sp. NPDC018031 TaxID=3365033 RepID=UPI0037880CCF
MTEYGRGPGSQPWHPEDPLYGDPGWHGQQPGAGHDPYAADPLGQQSYPQDPYGVPQHQHPGHYPDQHPEPYQQHGGQHAPHGAQYPQHGERYPHSPDPDPAQAQWQGQGQGQGQQAGYPGQPGPAYADGSVPAGQAHYGDGGSGGWDPGYGAADPTDPYQQPTDPYTGAQPDYYATPDAYPPPEPPYARHEDGAPAEPGHPGQPYREPDGGHPAGEPEPVAAMAAAGPDTAASPAERTDGGAPEADRLPGGALPRHSTDDDDFDDESTDGGRDRRGKKPKRRSGLACLVVAVVLTGFTGGVAYVGYGLWQSHFGAPPDYSGDGTGEVAVEVPEGAVIADIGNILKGEGVVKSTDAFIEAANDHPKGGSIQPGAYTLRKEMSAEAAVEMMTDPASMNGLIVTEGMRNVQVYAAIDKKIGLKAGTTEGVAKREADDLGLPDWVEHGPKVKDPLEGFLFPARYSVGKDAKPEAVLRQMVQNATKEYARHDLAGKAEELGLDSPMELITVASLVQAEGVTHDDFRKMSEVIYNRLKPGNAETVGQLQFDSTYNYAKNQSEIDITLEEIKNLDHPYNTYFYKGLPPGPIGNPGADALNAAQNPTHDGWYYFISLDGKTTKFTRTYAEHDKLVDQFNESRRND